MEPQTPDAVPVSLGDRIIAAARADMEFRSTSLRSGITLKIS